MKDIINPQIEQYIEKHTRQESPLLRQIAADTQEHPNAQMLTGKVEGQLLRMLVKLVGAKRVFEIGCFTGYSALTMAEAMPHDGEVITCEIDEQVAHDAQNYFSLSPHGYKIKLRIGHATDVIRAVPNDLDLIFIDADKENVLSYYNAVKPKLRKGGLLVVDNVLWSGKVIHPNDSEAMALDTLNKRIMVDPQMENIILPVRDGVQVAMKKP
jgi:caffeoyl-CoA O-methyltransferase